MELAERLLCIIIKTEELSFNLLTTSCFAIRRVEKF